MEPQPFGSVGETFLRIPHNELEETVEEGTVQALFQELMRRLDDVNKNFDDLRNELRGYRKEQQELAVQVKLLEQISGRQTKDIDKFCESMREEFNESQKNRTTFWAAVVMIGMSLVALLGFLWGLFGGALS